MGDVLTMRPPRRAADRRVTTCRRCAMAVIFAWVIAPGDVRSPRSQGVWPLPFDAHPDPELGTALLLDCNGDLVAFEGGSGGDRHASHRATCAHPAAGAARGGR